MRCLPLLALAGCARRYPAEGVVGLRVDAAQRSIVVSHRAIPGYMGAMTMPFRVAPREDLTKLTAGTRIDFQLRVGSETVARRLKPRVARIEGVDLPKPANKIAIGAELPDFSLIDQSGRAVRLSQFRGRVIALDFIYTRCPLPDVCPRLSANFAYLAKRLRGRDLELLSITLDPAYDRPEVLAEYARRWQADRDTWRFLNRHGGASAKRRRSVRDGCMGRGRFHHAHRGDGGDRPRWETGGDDRRSGVSCGTVAPIWWRRS